MLRQTNKAFGTLSIATQSPTLPSLARPSSSRSRSKELITEDDVVRARKWLEELDPKMIPESISKITYCKASGAGGQHVNTTNSKARLSTPLRELLPLIPTPLHERIRNSRYYTRENDSIMIVSDRTRKARDNRDDCFRKQYMMLKEIGKEVIPGERTSSPITEFGPRQLPWALVHKMDKRKLDIHNQTVRRLIKARPQKERLEKSRLEKSQERRQREQHDRAQGK